jgi:putative tryptophan/tyrosine transport system substrate-binding protein
MNRREFTTVLGGTAAAWPLAARAQQPDRMRRVGFLLGVIPPAQFGLGDLSGFTQGMRELGYLEVRDLTYETNPPSKAPDRPDFHRG